MVLVSSFCFGIGIIELLSIYNLLFISINATLVGSQEGYLSGVERIQSRVYRRIPTNSLGNLANTPSFFGTAAINDVAAVPSLHAAYPFLMLLFAWSYFGRKGWLVAPYVFLVGFGVVYLGEHYVIDVVLGVLYAAVAFVAIYNIGLNDVSDKDV